MSWQEKLIRSVGRAYQKHSCPEMSEADEYEHGKFWLDVLNPEDDHTASIITDSKLTVGEIAQIIHDHQQSKLIRQQKESTEENLEFLLGKIRAAQAVIHSRDAGRSTSQKYADALGILGLVFQLPDCERSDITDSSKARQLKAVYSDYCALRLGGRVFVALTGKFMEFEPHTHQQAFDIIQSSYKLGEWDSLAKQFRKYGLEYYKNPVPQIPAEVQGECFIRPVIGLCIEGDEYQIVHKEYSDHRVSDFERFSSPSAHTYSGKTLPKKSKPT